MSDPPPFQIPATVAQWITDHLVTGVFKEDITDLTLQ